ncbi:hypothetical protein [Corynebacterium sp. AOP40-4SA-5]|uniref:hypothetical protein n=1 Tax=Corynebacterium sp. AOP40-4SA-5 TaxID=3457678 RepID=UPI004033DC57
MHSDPPAPGSREYDIIRTLLSVESKGAMHGDDLQAMLDHDIDILTQLTYLNNGLDKQGVIQKMSLGNVTSCEFHLALFNWARNLTPPTPGDPE